jgi:hypothetical protein
MAAFSSTLNQQYTFQINRPNAAAFVKPGLGEAEVMEIKKAFDLFDTDQGESFISIAG